MSFDSLLIDPRCQDILRSQRLINPTDVQAQAIPVALTGQDMVVTAQTGTGKTLAFGLPALTRLTEIKTNGTRMLVLTPTRELATQVHDVLEPFARALRLRTACVYGGVGMERQAAALRKGFEVIVATPGRLIDHMDRRNARLEGVSVLVLDEADRMLDMGFMPAIKRILSSLSEDRQTLMFSATFAKEIADLSRTMLRNPVRISCGAVATPAKLVRQGMYSVHHDKKLSLLSEILRRPEVTSTVVFLRTKHRTERVAKALHQAGFRAEAIHGGRSQRQRQQVLDGFRDGKYSILVATDVAARGIDVSGITHVVNFDVPVNPDDYIHRIGRTARANASGDAITFVSPDEQASMRGIERLLGQRIEKNTWHGEAAAQAEPRGERPSRDYDRSERPRGERPVRQQGSSPRPKRQDDTRPARPARDENAPRTYAAKGEKRGYTPAAGQPARPEHGAHRTAHGERHGGGQQARPEHGARKHESAGGEKRGYPKQGTPKGRPFNGHKSERHPKIEHVSYDAPVEHTPRYEKAAAQENTEAAKPKEKRGFASFFRSRKQGSADAR